MSKTIALVGNPNSGKSTVFNALTGASQSVGNWPGVTVEKKSGKLKRSKRGDRITDLPGIYSLSTYSLEEVIAREYIESPEVDLIINVVDASNLERNLFLSLQLIEIGKPMIIVLNMMDVLEQRGDQLDTEKLEWRLGVPIVELVAKKERGIKELMALIETHEATSKPLKIYRSPIQKLIDYLQEELKIDDLGSLHAIRLIEEGMHAPLGHNVDPVHIAKLNEEIDERLKDEELDRDMIISDEKYRFITALAGRILIKAKRENESLSDKLDKLVTNRILAIPIFLVIMWAVFSLSFGSFGGGIKEYFEMGIELVIGGLASLLEIMGVSEWLYNLVVDGILGGVGSVLGFLPEITIMFLLLSVLEDTGYMARAAFIMDRVLRRFGLSGKSFIPMMIGFGCTVPALMAARTLDSERDRRLTMMITPFMSCSARFPIYAVFAAALFGTSRALVVYSIYILGILVAFLSGFVLKGFVTKHRVSNFMMELPEYRLPTLKNLTLHTWDKVKDFIVKAGTILVLASIIIYLMNTYTFSLKPAAESVESMLGVIGSFIAPVFAPLGFGDWRSSIALVVGFIAKEAVVSTLGVLYGIGGDVIENSEALIEPIRMAYTPLSAYAYMVFTLLYMPCVAAFATMKREFNSWKWTMITVIYQTGLAWLLAFAVYQGGRLLGWV